MKNALIISLIIALILASYFLGRRTPTEVEIVKTDTITVTKTDTIRVTEVKEIEKRVVSVDGAPQEETYSVPEADKKG